MHRIFVSLVAAFLALMPPAAAAQKVPSVPPARTATPQPTPVATVTVEAEAAEMEAARQRAMAMGEERAFLDVLRARDPDRASGIARKVTPAQRSQLVKSVTVEREVARAGHYQADITYVFNEAMLNQLIEEQKGLVPEFSNDALLVLPIFENGTQLLLWEKENYWRSLMARAALEGGDGKLVVPFGDPRDALLVDSRTALAGSAEPLQALARRYGTGNAVLLTARFAEQDGKTVLQVRLRRPGQKPEDELVKSYPAESAQETHEALMRRAARDTAGQLLGLTQQFSLFAAPDALKLQGKVLRAEFRFGREWLGLRKRLEGLPGVELMDIGAISPNYAQITLYYRGPAEPIAQAIRGRGLVLRETGEFWTVTPY